MLYNLYCEHAFVVQILYWQKTSAWSDKIACLGKINSGQTCWNSIRHFCLVLYRQVWQKRKEKRGEGKKAMYLACMCAKAEKVHSG